MIIALFVSEGEDWKDVKMPDSAGAPAPAAASGAPAFTGGTGNVITKHYKSV